MVFPSLHLQHRCHHLHWGPKRSPIIWFYVRLIRHVFRDRKTSTKTTDIWLHEIYFYPTIESIPLVIDRYTDRLFFAHFFLFRKWFFSPRKPFHLIMNGTKTLLPKKKKQTNKIGMNFDSESSHLVHSAPPCILFNEHWTLFMIHSIDKLWIKEFSSRFFAVAHRIDFITYFYWFKRGKPLQFQYAIHTTNNSWGCCIPSSLIYLLYSFTGTDSHCPNEIEKQNSWKENFRIIGYKWMVYNWTGKLDSNQCECTWNAKTELE